MSKIIYLIIIFLFINCDRSQKTKVIGQYSGGHEFSATELALMENHKFKLKEFYDVGGWRDPINGNWQLKQDTLLLNSQWIPQIVKVEKEVMEDSPYLAVISLWDSSGIPYNWTYEIEVGNTSLTKGKYDSVEINNNKIYPITYYYLTSESLTQPPEQIRIGLNGARLTYNIDDLSNSEYRFFIDAPEDSVILRRFVDKDKWILSVDTLFSIYNSELNRNYYLVKQFEKPR
jgi:hypothetical protein